MNDRNSLPSVVLMYHRIGSPLVRSVVRGQYVTPFLLRRQLAAMLAQGYRPVTPVSYTHLTLPTILLV